LHKFDGGKAVLISRMRAEELEMVRNWGRMDGRIKELYIVPKWYPRPASLHNYLIHLALPLRSIKQTAECQKLLLTNHGRDSENTADH
jgi:hypothetical protein